MLDLIMALGLVAMTLALIAYPIVMLELDWSLNPLRWKRSIRTKREYKQIRRISKLEHELGYKPCSDSECYSCNRMVEMPNGSYYQMRPDINHLIEQGWDKEVGVSLWKRTGTVSGGPR